MKLWSLLLLLKLTIINTTIKKLILHSVVLDPLENAKIKSVPKTSQYYAIYNNNKCNLNTTIKQSLYSAV